MPRQIALHLLALVAVLGHSTADAQHSPAKNLISSGGFEGPIANFPKWHTKDQQFENDGCIYCGPTTEMAFRGKQSCKIQTTGTRGDCLRYVCTNIQPGKAYRYEFHYQIKSSGIYISSEGGLPQFFRLEGPTKEWKKFSVVFVADETRYVATIGRFRRQKPNLIYIDDIKLLELPKLPVEFTPRPFRIAKLPLRPHRPARHTTLLAHFDEIVSLDDRRPRGQGLLPRRPQTVTGLPGRRRRLERVLETRSHERQRHRPDETDTGSSSAWRVPADDPTTEEPHAGDQRFET